MTLNPGHFINVIFFYTEKAIHIYLEGVILQHVLDPLADVIACFCAKS